MAIILTPFIVLAAIGLTLSLVAHGCALLGLPQPLGGAAWGLHIGVFVVWLPAVLVSTRLVRDFKQKDFWKAALRGCPNWMRWITYGFFFYAIINFITFMFAAPGGQRAPNAPAPPDVFRGFSGHWMAFYSAAIAIMYSAIVVAQHDTARRCPSGHPVSPSADFCENCGAKIIGSKFDVNSADAERIGEPERRGPAGTTGD
jgi:hypothetical protein